MVKRKADNISVSSDYVRHSSWFPRISVNTSSLRSQAQVSDMSNAAAFVAEMNRNRFMDEPARVVVPSARIEATEWPGYQSDSSSNSTISSDGFGPIRQFDSVASLRAAREARFRRYYPDGPFGSFASG